MYNPFRGLFRVAERCPIQAILFIIFYTLLAVLTLTMVIVFSPSIASANDHDIARIIIENYQGSERFTVRKGYGDRQVIYNDRGARVGTITKGYGDRRIIRDNAGKRVGSIEEYGDHYGNSYDDDD